MGGALNGPHPSKVVKPPLTITEAL
jgi:hypothetical protein